MDNGVVHGESLRTYGDAVDIPNEKLIPLIKKLQNFRDKAMETKDFSAVDELKAALIDAGVEVQMSKDGVNLKPASGYDSVKLEALL